jgi:hypothetical protein
MDNIATATNRDSTFKNIVTSFHEHQQGGAYRNFIL